MKQTDHSCEALVSPFHVVVARFACLVDSFDAWAGHIS
jgi:hypothetical protein